MRKKILDLEKFLSNNIPIKSRINNDSLSGSKNSSEESDVHVVSSLKLNQSNLILTII